MQVIFAVEDVARAAAFYDEAFGWPRNPLVDFRNYVEYLLPEGGALGIYQRRGFAGEVGAEPFAADADHVSQAYVYFRVDDVDATSAAIEAAGGRPLSPLAERAWGEQAGWFADPDGNVIAVAQRVPTADPAAA
jgi:predicted enzyme related to lactoylglutathione lyase